MKNKYHPKWFLLTSILPLLYILILILIKSHHQLIDYLKDPFDKFVIGLASLILFTTLGLLYSCIRWKQKKDIHLIALILGFIVPSFIYFALFEIGDIPQALPNYRVWGIQFTSLEFVSALFSIGIVYSLLFTIVKLQVNKPVSVVWSVVFAVVLPLFVYFMSTIDVALHFKGLPESLIEFLLIASAIFVTYHIVYILVWLYKRNSDVAFYKNKLLIIIFSLILPIIGLMLNRDEIMGFAGNFNNIWFYILAIVNGLLLLLPEINNVFLRLWLYVARTALFVYTVYFFILFLPYMPLGIILILAVGIGFLLLTPIVLFFIHFNVLRSEYQYLKNYIHTGYLIPITILSFSIIPITVHYSLFNNYLFIEETIQILDKPDYNATAELNDQRLDRILKLNGNSFGSTFNKQATPIISHYYKTVVLKNKSISEPRKAALNSVIKHRYPPTLINEAPEHDSTTEVQLVDYHVVSEYDSINGLYTSKLELELLAKGDSSEPSSFRNNREYFTSFDLPTGCYVADYYLMINDTLEKGILAEKKAANWVYDQIVNRREDPGFLKYITGERLSLQVFPFASGQLRKTGITFIHKEATQLKIDDTTIVLGNPDLQFKKPYIINKEGITYISAEAKNNLDTISRQPFYHFIIDGSKNAKPEKWNKIIASFLEEYPLGKNGAQVSIVNANEYSFELNEQLEEELNKYEPKAGFNLNLSIRRGIFRHYQNNNTTYPLFIVCTDEIKRAFVETDFADMQFMYPDNNYFYSLSSEGKINQHDLFHFPLEGDSINSFEVETKKVFVYSDLLQNKHFLSSNPGPEIVFNDKKFDFESYKLGDNNWENGLFFQTANRYFQIYPYRQEQYWNETVYQSFATRLLTPATAYIALETERQKEILKQKQEEVLAGIKSENLGEEAQMMSEPQAWWFVVPCLVFLWWRKRKNVAV